MEELTSKQKAIGRLYEAQLLGYDRCELVPSYFGKPRVCYLHARSTPFGPYKRRIPICALTLSNIPLSHYRGFTSFGFEEAAHLIDQAFEFLL